MESLRQSKRIAQLVLVWFALFMGSAIASTLIHPGQMQMVCTAGGDMKLVDVGDEGDVPAVAVGMDCPLCASVAPPLPVQTSSLPTLSPLAHALHPVAAAHIASVTAPPLPSRGPPTSLL